MKQVLAILLFSSWAYNCIGQQYNREKTCNLDTVIVRVDRVHQIKTITNDTSSSYKAFECTQVSKLGIRIDLGFTGYTYNNKTKRWIGNHNGALFGFILAYKNLNFGFRFKPWTVNPKSELVFNDNTLNHAAKLNPIKLDYYFGYSFDLNHNISLEPYLGMTRNIFVVINEKELNKTFNIPTSNGLITGLTLNKYFKINEFEFLSVFVNHGYSWTDFTQTDNQLGTGYSEWAIGIAYKGFYKRHFLERIN